MQSKIVIADLKRIANELFDHLESNGETELDFDADYYWVISKDERYNAYAEPKKLYLGQLTSDYDSLRKILARDELEPTASALIELSAILRYVGERIMY